MDDDDDTGSVRTRTAPTASSTYASTDYYSDYKVAMDYNAADYPPMPAYAGGYHQYNGSVGTLEQHGQPYDEDYQSQVHLASAAAPYGRSDDAHLQQHGGYAYDQYDGYRSGSTAPDYRSASTAPYGYHGQQQHQQQAMYQEDYHPNPYSPGAQQHLGYGHGQQQQQQQYGHGQQQQQQQQYGHDPYGYQRQSNGSDGYAHAM